MISAAWLSGTGDVDGTLNLRGVSTVLALAAFLKRMSSPVIPAFHITGTADRAFTMGKRSRFRGQRWQP